VEDRTGSAVESHLAERSSGDTAVGIGIARRLLEVRCDCRDCRRVVAGNLEVGIFGCGLPLLGLGVVIYVQWMASMLWLDIGD
jgi:hypothetical protein